MDKAQLLAELTANGNISVLRRSPSWEKAFDVYNKLHGTNLRPSCGTCFRTVLQWLRS
jgi:hypothetical protein